MKSSLVPVVTCLVLLSLRSSLCLYTPMFYNVSMDSSGDAELELLFPSFLNTQAPVQVNADPGAANANPDPNPDSNPNPNPDPNPNPNPNPNPDPNPTITTTTTTTITTTITNTITTTMIRLKDFVLTRVVDFLQENLLIIIVVTSLLIVMVFIICCASAMSHKRKLEAYKPLPNPPRKYMADKTAGHKNSSEFQERPYAVDHVKRVQTQAMSSPKNLRMPTKALVGEKGREPRSSPRQEVRKVREVQEVEKRREEPKHKEQPRYREEVQQSSSSSQPVCTCHLKKGHH